MKSMVKNNFVIMMLLLFNNNFGYFYYACVTKKVINKNGSPQCIVLFADYHDKTHPANKGQRAYLESLLRKYSNQKIKLIVEDLSSVNNDGRMICCNYGVNCTEGVLGYLANRARSLGIIVDNVEYRYCRVAGIGPLLNNIEADPHSFKSSSVITLAVLYKEIIDEIEKIRKYDDGKKLNAFYKHAIADVHAMLSKMCLAAANHKITVADHCVTLKKNKYRKQLEKLCIFDSVLIDINIMHSIIGCDASIIFVVAGGSHIEEVNKLLKRMGYEEVFVISSGTTSQPIDISVLDSKL